MRSFGKVIGCLLAVVCMMLMSFVTVFAAEPVNIMPASDAGYTIVSGQGTVKVENGVTTITNTGDEDLRLNFKTETPFDLSALPVLHMEFTTDMTFKMAYHLAGSNGTSGWVNTSDNFANLFTISGDRAAAGTFNVDMKLDDQITSITDISAVTYETFIILLSGKGTFTINAITMTDGTQSTPDTTTTAANDTTAAPETTTVTAENTTAAPTTVATDAPTTTVVNTTADQAKMDSAKTGDVSDAVLGTTIAVLAATAVVMVAVTKKREA